MPPDSAPPVPAFVAIGANLGDAAATVRAALRDLAALPATRLERGSGLYRSASMGADGPDYVNAVAELSTGLEPHVLLAALQRLEAAAGRTRSYPNAPRTLDLDVLLYGDQRIDSPSLTVPHPRMHERAFVLLPLAEIAPARVDAAALQAVAGQRIARIAD